MHGIRDTKRIHQQRNKRYRIHPIRMDPAQAYPSDQFCWQADAVAVFYFELAAEFGYLLYKFIWFAVINLIFIWLLIN